MSAEQGYYFSEIVRLVSTLLPVGFILAAMIFLRRTQRTGATLLLQALAAVWFVIAMCSRLLLSRLVGIGKFGSANLDPTFEQDAVHMQLYDMVSSVLYFAELAAFMLFAAALFGYFRQRSRIVRVTNGPLRELNLTAKLAER